MGREGCGNGGNEEEESEKVARGREDEVRLSHSGGVGVCLSSPLAHNNNKRGSERVFFLPRHVQYPFLNSHLFIAAQVEERSALCSLA